MGEQLVGDGEEGHGVFTAAGGVAVEGEALHLQSQHAHFPPGLHGGDVVIEGVVGGHVAHGDFIPLLPGDLLGLADQREGGDGGEGTGELVLGGVAGVGAGAQGDDQVADVEVFLDGAGGADAHDVLHAVEVEKLIGVDTHGGASHAAALDGDRDAVVLAGIAQHTADTVDLHGVGEEVFGDELGPEGIAGHEHGGGVGPFLGFNVRSRHKNLLIINDRVESEELRVKSWNSPAANDLKSVRLCRTPFLHSSLSTLHS